jgi:hypothetical protein
VLVQQEPGMILAVLGDVFERSPSVKAGKEQNRQALAERVRPQRRRGAAEDAAAMGR